MLNEFLSRLNDKAQIDISETLIDVRVIVQNVDNTQDFTYQLFEELKTLSSRDSFELDVSLNGDTESISSCSQTELKNLKSHFANHEDLEEFSLDFKIRKTLKNSVMSVYFLKKFIEYLSNESLLNVIKTFSDNFVDCLNFEVFSNIGSFGSTTIRFYESSTNHQYKLTQLPRLETLALVVDNGITTNLATNLLPSDFNLLSLSEDERLNNFFFDACVILSFAFISNTSELSLDNNLSLKIHGYKSVAFKSFDFQSYRLKKDLLIQIYAWAYQGGNNSDKLGLIRNVLSIHTDKNSNVIIDEEVWLAIQSNYQIYLKGNVKSYLEVKGKIGELLVQATAKTYSLVDEILQAFKQNVVVMLTFVITTLIINGLKAKSDEVLIFSNMYFYVLLFLIFISLIWMHMVKNDSKSRFEVASASTNEIILLNYKIILMESEIKNLIDPIQLKNSQYLESQIKKYICWWTRMVIAILIFFLLGNYLFIKNSIFEKAFKLIPISEVANIKVNKELIVLDDKSVPK